jgi:DNA-directed RNA polymerase subunit RPC12/RpoP
MTTAYVTCPRCEFRMSVRLHQITSTDEQACPRCKAEGISVPMLLMPDAHAEQPEPDVPERSA